MGLLFGYFEANEYSQPVKENNDESSYSNNNPSHPLGFNGSLQKLESDPPRQKANTKRGKTRGKGRKLEYWEGNRWVPAVYHHDIRAFLIEEAGQQGEYTYPRERGPECYDVTSFLESQKDWGPVRDENWADILYEFHKGNNRIDPTYDVKVWMFYGKIVISGYDDQPMRRFRDLPDTLSSALHGRDMEAMKRTDPRIQQRDIMARMPLRHTTPAGTRRPLQSASSIGMRMTRFRQQQGMLSWLGRDGSQTIRDALWERLPPENKLANSIRGLQPPSVAEQLEAKKGNAGKFLNRAGRRALTIEERARRQEIMERRLKKRQRAQKNDIAVRTLADKVGIDGLPKPDTDIPSHDATAGRPANTKPDTEQSEYKNRPGRPGKEGQARRHEISKHQAKGGNSGDNLRGRRPASKLDTGQLTQPNAEKCKSPANNSAPIVGIYSGESFESTAPPQGFDLNFFLEAFCANEENDSLATIPSPPKDCDLELLLSGLLPAAFDNRNPSQSNHSSPLEGWNFNYSVPGSLAGSDDKNSSLKKYPSPTNYNFNVGVPLGDSQQPYYHRSTQQS